MKLIYISEGNIPSLAANSMQVMKMSQAFAEVLPSFELVTLGDLSSWLRRARFDFWTWYGIRRPFRITRLPLLRRAEYPFPANYRLPRFPRWAARYACWRQPDVVYTRSELAAWYTLCRGRKVILETHALASPGAWYTRFSDQRVAKNLLGLVTISPILAESYVAVGVPSDRLIVAYDGVDLERFAQGLDRRAARASLNLPAEARVAVYVGHLYENRGVEEIMACAGLMPDTLFVLVGGWETDVQRRRQEVEQRKLTNVWMIGFVPNAEVPLYLAAGDVLLMPYSQKVSTGHWMSPMKMFEYMAAQRPILATDLPAIRQVLQDQRNAILVAPDDATALLSGLVVLLQDQALGARLAAQSYRDVQAYTWEKRAARILEFLGSW